MEREILIAVARADLILCEIGRIMPFILGPVMAITLAALANTLRRR